MSAAAAVEVYAVWLSASPAVTDVYRSFLSPEETARAGRFVFAEHRERFELSQGALRLLLAGYLKCGAQEVILTKGLRGKPALFENARLAFNKSHSHTLALYAFTEDCEIGVDVEELRPVNELERIACRSFCSAETAELMSLDTSISHSKVREEAFYRCWTRKEAYIKAVGDGLYLPLDQFRVTLLPDDPVRIVWIQADENLASEWTLEHLAPAPGYVGAVAYRAKPRLLRFHTAVDCVELLDQKLGYSEQRL